MRDVPRWTPPATDDDGRLSYFTQGVPMPPVQQVPPQDVVNSVPPQFAAPPRPLTRRQLRELEISQGTRPQADDAPELAPAPRIVAAPATSRAAAQPSTPPVATVAQPIIPPAVRLAPPVPVPVPAEQAAPRVASPEPVVFTDASGAAPTSRSPIAPRPVNAPRPVKRIPVVSPAADVESQSTPPAVSLAANRGIDSAPEIFTSPDAHWSTQTHIDAANQPGDSFVRRVGSSGGPVTTNALVIPSIPQASDITRPFSSTGEILVTGSIDLPMSLGSTGATPTRYDHSDIDALFAQEDHDYAPADAAPVRAIRAVSTHTSTHGVISAKKPANNRLPMMMAVTAGILAVGVAALFAAGMIFGYF
ncbi:MAG TPA: hypothetical protein VFT01_07165 [Homoserinimonas sp.]|nr:hypothetical protein [Homoserinimonas sp.]